MKNIAVIGGGASGMAAAIAAAESGKDVRVYILEQKDMTGKKILSTGNGRCNLTNEYMDAKCFRSDHPEYIKSVLETFGTKDTLELFERLGILTKSRNGYIYPRSDQASAVLEVLQMHLIQLGVKSHTGVHVNEIVRTKKGFRIVTSEGNFSADKVILATGGKAASVLGSDGSGYALAKSFGHRLAPVVPALVQLKVKKNPLQKASGVRMDVTVSALDDGSCVASDTGELQITAYGISGIPVFQISRYIAKALYYKRRAEVAVDFVPYMSESEFFDMLIKRRENRADYTAHDFLIGIFNKKMIPRLLELSGIKMNTKIGSLSEKDFRRLAHQCKNTILEITETNGFDNAQVCAGGVHLDEINIQTMESQYMEGLYIVGELLDVDGICGGYNLQWAWATGTIAGKHAAI